MYLGLAFRLCFVLRRVASKLPVLFVDVGHASTNVALVSFGEGELTVLGRASDRSIGGRDFNFARVRCGPSDLRCDHGRKRSLSPPHPSTLDLPTSLQSQYHTRYRHLMTRMIVTDNVFIKMANRG
jgi:hypothetical protein